jgi:hypothetical protein
MGRVRVRLDFPGKVSEAEALWYDTARWSSWIEGLGHVASIDGDWPHAGAKVIWDSSPAGRGRVVERVAAYEPRVGQTLEVEDETLRGRQTVGFEPLGDQLEISFELEYQLKQRSIVTPLVDLLFIRRALAQSLRRTLTRFGIELAAEREMGAERTT